MRKARFEPGRSVRQRMSSNSATPKVSFRPRVTAALFSCGIIGLLWNWIAGQQSKLMTTPDRWGAAGLLGAELPTAAQRRNVRIAQDWSLSDITRVSGRRPVLSLASLHLYLACFLCVRLTGRGPVIFEARGGCCASLPDCRISNQHLLAHPGPLSCGAGAAAKCRNLSGLRTTYSAPMTSPSISNVVVCTGSSGPSKMTVLLGYSAEAEFCVSSSEFTSVAVRPPLVKPVGFGRNSDCTDAAEASQPK